MKAAARDGGGWHRAPGTPRTAGSLGYLTGQMNAPWLWKQQEESTCIPPVGMPRSGLVRSGEGALQGSRLAHIVRSPGLGRPRPGCHPPSLHPEGRSAARARVWGLRGASLDHSSSCSSSSEPEGPWRTSSYHLLVSVFIWMRPWWRSSWVSRRVKKGFRYLASSHRKPLRSCRLM